MAPSHSQQQCAKYQYVVTAAGPRIVPVPDAIENRDEESAVDYNSGGYCQIKVNDAFKGGRYIVQRKLGWGHFSTVWLVNDTEFERHSALKVVKSASRYAETARDEIKLLREVMNANPQHPGRDFVVSFLDSFIHKSLEEAHVCIVFEPLGENMLALIERNRVKGVPRLLVKAIAHQTLLGLQYLHDECDFVHTDIKPENIMIAIPDVEALIRAELSMSPSPTSRRVGVPPGKSRTGGVLIPKKNRDRHVHIFDSQPLPGPSTGSLSRPASPGSHPGHSLRMSQITKSKSVNIISNDTVSLGSAPQSAINSTATSAASSMISNSLALSTPPTSLGSMISKTDSFLDTDGAEKVAPSSPLVAPKEAPTARQLNGPSLLAQTLKEHAPTESPRAVAPPRLESIHVATEMPIHIKIADLGNATPSRVHFTEDIQTRQYRAPEAILGRSDWDHTADIWSVACVIFELLTAEYLFDPQAQGTMFSKDDDHMAQIIELLGDFTLDVKMGGRYSREIFDAHGQLRYIKTLKPWPLYRVMTEKYLFTENDAVSFCSFLEPMLRVDFRARARASDMLDHTWLDSRDEAQDSEEYP